MGADAHGRGRRLTLSHAGGPPPGRRPAGRARANEEYDRRGGDTTELWNLPDAPHAAALRTDPTGYERRVIGFLDRALR